MALTLDAALAAAQDSQSRKPLVEIISSQKIDDIPFDGSLLTAETFNEYGVNLIPHSSGRLAMAYCYGADSDGDCGIKYVYTDAERLEFFTVTIELYTAPTFTMKAVSICEMTGGNIGLVYLVDDQSTGIHYYRLLRRIITVTGAAVSSAEIANWSHDTYTSDPWVATLGANSYLLIYGKKSGSNYFLYKRTSADFLTWSAETYMQIDAESNAVAALTIADSACVEADGTHNLIFTGANTTPASGTYTISGNVITAVTLTTGGTGYAANPTVATQTGDGSVTALISNKRLGNPSILKISTGDLWLWFDVHESTSSAGNELTNIYYSVSSDNGATWSVATKLTNHTLYSEVALHPVAVQKTANQMHLIYSLHCGAMHLGEDNTGWPTGDATYELSWDGVNRKLYAINYGSGSGALTCIVKIDVDTWTVDTYWDSTTTPTFSSAFFVYDTYVSRRGATIHDGHHIIVVYDYLIGYLNGEDNTIVEYNINPTGGNVSGVPVAGYVLCHVSIDAANNKIWMLHQSYPNAYPWCMSVGYLDLTESSNYAYHPVWTSTDGQFSLDELGTWQVASAGGGFYVDVASNVIVIAGGYTGTPCCGFFVVIDIGTGALIHEEHFVDYAYSLPLVYNNKVYCGRGIVVGGYLRTTELAEIDLTTGIVEVLTPTYLYLGTPSYMGRPTYLQDGKIAYVHEPYGVIVFDTVARSWEVFNDDNVAGLTISGSASSIFQIRYTTQIVYDDLNDLLMFGDVDWSGHGVVMFSVHGAIKQTYYSIGTMPGAAWEFSAPTAMIQSYLDYDAAAAVEPGSTSAMYVFWANENTAQKKAIKWDKDGSSHDVSPYLIGEVAAEQGISGNFATLNFTVSHGHLFDPYNTQSTLNAIFKKGRKLTLRWGEKISGTDYWQNAGTFYVTGASLSFQRGAYPVMKVMAEDERCLWTFSHVYATAIYNNTPKEILDGVLGDFADKSASELNIPAISTAKLQNQWIETTIDEIVTQVCERFGYYFRFDCDGLCHARLISNSAAVDHAYTDNTKLLKYTPDDKYSDFTNRVMVKGQSLTFVDVVYAEEKVGALSGSLGWWGCKADHKIEYSTDGSRRVQNPRLVVVETSTSIALNLAGGVSEYLVDGGEDADYKYCIVYVEAPSLVAALLVLLVSLAAASFIPDPIVAVGFIANAGTTIPVGSAIRNLLIIAIMNILGSVANYSFEIYGEPLGKIRQSLQAVWNDTDHQTEINAIVEQTIDDPLCYSIGDCTAVAAFEGMVAQMQRRRIMIQKVAHIQDEDGDTISIVHPYSGQTINIFVANLRRTFKKADAGGDGYFLDEIEGWVLP